MTIEEQLGNLTKRVYQLEKEVAQLKAGALTQEAAPISAEIEKTNQLNAVQTENVQVEKEQTESVQSDFSVTAKTTEAIEKDIPAKNNVQATIPTRPAVSAKSTMEKTVGIKVMAAVASVLVFVSLILFVGMVYKYLTDEVKIGLMFAVSVGFTVLGILKMGAKSKHKALFSAVAGCGVGGLYITILAAYFLLSYVSLPIIIAVLVLWTVFVMLLSRFLSKMFLYICYVGISITTVYFGFFGETSPIALIYFLVSVALLFVLNYTGNFLKDVFFFIQLPISAGVLVWCYHEWNWVYFALMAMVAVTAILITCLYKTEGNQLPLRIFHAVLSVLSIAYIAIILNDATDGGITYLYEIVAAILIAIAAVYWLKMKNYAKGLRLTVLYLVAALLAMFVYSDFTDKYLGIWVLMLCLIVAGNLLKEAHFKYVGYAYFMIYALQKNSIATSEILLPFVVMLATLILATVFVKLKYSLADKLLVTLGWITLVFELWMWDAIDHTVAFILLAAISLVINLKWYTRDFVTGLYERPAMICGYVMNLIMMFCGSLMIIDCDHNLRIVKELPESALLMMVIVSMLTIALYCANTVELFNLSLPQSLIGVYVCLKFTWLIAAILIRFEATSYVFSLVGLIIAVVCIILGFMLKQKAFRLYGLVLSLLCVLKLVIVDIEYAADFMKPISYFIAGILCFGISWFYSRIEKKEASEEVKNIQ